MFSFSNELQRWMHWIFVIYLATILTSLNEFPISTISTRTTDWGAVACRQNMDNRKRFILLGGNSRLYVWNSRVLVGATSETFNCRLCKRIKVECAWQVLNAVAGHFVFFSPSPESGFPHNYDMQLQSHSAVTARPFTDYQWTFPKRVLLE